MKKRAFSICCVAIAVLQFLSAFAVSYRSTVLSDTLQLFYGPVLLVAMLDSSLFLVVESLIELILKKSTERAKQIIILITSLVSEIVVAAVWIHFMVIILEYCSDSYYISDIMLADEIIMLFPVAAVIPLMVFYLILRLDLRLPKRKKKTKKKTRKSGFTKAPYPRKAAKASSGTQGDNTTEKGSEI